MKKRMQSLACICAALFFAACGGKHNANHEHEHNHEMHQHEAHTHENSHSHESHEHSHEGHTHEHEGHSHEHEGHSHEHGEGIAFTKQQAEAAGLKVEIVEKGSFSGVIKTAGHIQTPKGSEAVVVATSAGVLYYTDPSIAEGVAVGTGKALAGISAKKLQDGDPSQGQTGL